MKSKSTNQITFNKDLLTLIKELTAICNSVVVNKQDDKIIISHGNDSESLGYILRDSVNNFNFVGDKLAFYDFREFYQLLDVFSDPTLTISDDNRFIKMTDEKTKINYLLTDEDTIECGPESLDFGESDASIEIDSNTLLEIRKMLNVMFAQSAQGIPIKCKVVAENDKIVMTFFKDEFDNSFERTFKCDVKKNFEYVAQADMFIDIPKGSYTIDFLEIGMIRLTMNNINACVEIFTGEVK